MSEDKNKKLPTTPEHFETFKNEARKWIRFFGLNGWQIQFAHKENDKRGFMACDIAARLATIGLCVEWEEYVDDALSDYNVRRVAFHEVCELMMARVAAIARCRFGWDEQDLDESIHDVIRRLENTIFEAEK